MAVFCSKGAGGVTFTPFQATNQTAVSGDMLLRYSCHRNKTDVQDGSTLLDGGKKKKLYGQPP